MPSFFAELLGSRRTWVSRTGHHGHRSSRKCEPAPVLTNLSNVDCGSVLPGPLQTYYRGDKDYLTPAEPDCEYQYPNPTDKIRLTLSQRSTHLPTCSSTIASRSTTATTGICLLIRNNPCSRYLGMVWCKPSLLRMLIKLFQASVVDI